jgi:arylsulfatase A-like enzyme
LTLGRRFAPLAALLLCALIRVVVAYAYACLRGDPGPTGYLVLVASLTLAVALATGLAAAALSASVEATLVAWVAIETLARFGTSLSLGLPLALGLAATAAFALWLASRKGESALAKTILVGIALSAGFTFGKPAFDELPLGAAVGSLPAWAWVSVVYAAALLPLALLSRVGWRISRVPVAPVAGAVVLVVVLGAIARFSPGPDLSGFAKERAHVQGLGPNILLLVLDTVRADHMSIYGYELPTTPELERRLRLENGAVVYPYAFAPSNWTIPSHVSLFTGLMPTEHQSHFGNDIAIDHRSRWAVDLPETLAQRLAGVGYRTAGVIGNPYLMLLQGAGKGFDLWLSAEPPRPIKVLGEQLRRRRLPRAFGTQRLPVPTATAVNRGVLGLLDECQGGGCFIMANYMEAHTPYWANMPFAGRFTGSQRAVLNVKMSHDAERAELAARAYDEEILELDSHLGNLLRRLQERGLLDSMWIFITSDHGEAFLEHESIEHGSSLYNEQVRVPLIVQPPLGTRLPGSEAPVGLLDVTATISAIATGEPWGHGRDLRDPDRPELPVQIEFFGWADRTQRVGKYSRLPMRAVLSGDWKLIEFPDHRELYTLRGDPHERNDRASASRARVEQLGHQLPPLRIESDRVYRRDAPLDPVTRDALRALGYLDAE